MTDQKWVMIPVEPTPEMVEAAEDEYMPFGDMEMAIRMAVLAAPQPAEQQPAPDVATQVLSLISDECRYWQGRDETRRGGYAILYAKAKELISKQQPSPDVAGLVEALEGLLGVIGESRGVSGYHLNGEIAEWDEFQEVHDATEALAAHQNREWE